MRDGMLAHLRDTYPTETAWAPRWAGDELRRARPGSWDARLAATCATAESAAARRAGGREETERLHALAVSYQALHEAYQQREAALEATMADPRRLGGGHPPAAAARHRRRRRAAPPPPRPAPPAATLRRA